MASERHTDHEDIRRQLEVGMPVVSNDGDKLGTVKEILGDSFRVDRSLAPDVTVSFNDVEAITPDGVTLSVDAGSTTTLMEGFPTTRPPYTT